MISTSIQFRVRKTLLFLAALLTSLHISAAGWVPTDAGLVLNFEPGDQFLLSVMIDGTEYFVCDYPSYNGGRFKYEAKNHLKLVPQTAGATEPSAVSIWTVDTALTRVVKNVNYSLGGASYTMWSNSGQTLLTSDGIFKYLGALGTTGGANVDKDPQLCDVVFAVPTNRSTNMDPNNTLKKTITPPATSFDGAMGTGFLGMTYREVYWFNIPKGIK